MSSQDQAPQEKPLALKSWNRFVVWIGIIGSICSITGIGFFSVWSNYRNNRKPTFFITENGNINVISQESISDNPIKISKTVDGIEEIIKRDVFITEFYFWNPGKEQLIFEDSISSKVDGKREINILVNNKLNDINIISSKCLSINQEYTGFNLSIKSNNSLNLTFNNVGYREGAKCQILFEGSSDAKINIEARFNNGYRVQEFGKVRSVRTKIITILVNILILCLICMFLFYLIRNEDLENLNNLTQVECWILVYSAFAFLVLISGFNYISDLIIDRNSQAPNFIVPVELQEL